MLFLVLVKPTKAKTKGKKKIGIKTADKFKNRPQNKDTSLLSVIKPKNKPSPHKDTDKQKSPQAILVCFFRLLKYTNVEAKALVTKITSPEDAKTFMGYLFSLP
jgi:hypothetical protein